jgi:hypothetical protein
MFAVAGIEVQLITEIGDGYGSILGGQQIIES